jgi:hypothetical protein
MNDNEKFITLSNILSIIEKHSGKKSHELQLDQSTDKLFECDVYRFGHVVMELFEHYQLLEYTIPEEKEFEFFPTIDSLLSFFHNTLPVPISSQSLVV